MGGGTLIPVAPEILIDSDASLKGWGPIAYSRV